MRSKEAAECAACLLARFSAIADREEEFDMHLKNRRLGNMKLATGGFSRRRLLTAGGVVAGVGLCLPHGFLQNAFAQSVTFDYYIGPNGNDNNAGTQSAPWAISAINSKRSLYAGKRVGLLDGTYNLVNILGQSAAAWSSNQLVIAAGSASSPTVIAALNRHKAIIDGARPQCTSGAEGGLLGPGGSYVTIDGIKFIRANYSAITSIRIGDRLTVENCWFDDQVFAVGSGGGKNSATIFIEQTNNTTIRNCRLENGGAPIDGDRHSYVLFYNSRDCVVEYCTIIANSIGGNGVHFKATTDNRRMTVRYCYIDRTGSSNTTSKECIRWHGNPEADGAETMHHNVLVIGAHGAPLMPEAAGTSNRWLIYNNTMIGGSWNDDGALCFLNLGNPTIEVYNNIFSRSAVGWQGDVRIPSIAKVVNMDFNIYDSSPQIKITDSAGATWNTLASWQSASGRDARSLMGDPLFLLSGVDAARYKVQAASPAKSLRTDGLEVGAWGGATQIGCDFSVANPVIKPSPAHVDSVT